MAVWPWGALYLLRASLSSLQSLGVTTCPMEQHEKKRISAGQGSQGACWPRGGRGPVVPPCPSQHHTPHWFPSPGQDNTGWHSTSWAGPKGLTGTHGPRGCQPSFESKGLPALVAMNLQAASPRPKRRPPHLGCPFIAGHDQVVAFLTWANTRHP